MRSLTLRRRLPGLSQTPPLQALMNKFSMFPLFSSLNSLCMSTDKCRYKLIGWLILCCFMLEHFPNECVEKKIHGLKISCGCWSENIIFLVEKLSRSQLKVYGLLIINSCGLALILYFASTVHCDLLKKKECILWDLTSQLHCIHVIDFLIFCSIMLISQTWTWHDLLFLQISGEPGLH